MENKPVFYIAHTFEIREYVRDVLTPRLHELGIETMNPFYNPDGSWREDRPEIKVADQEGQSQKWKNTVEKRKDNIVENDLEMIFFKSDGVIAIMPNISAGTLCEIWSNGLIKWFMKHNFINGLVNKPVLLVTESERNRMHPWVNYACDGIFRDDEELIDYLTINMKDIIAKIEMNRECLKKTIYLKKTLY